MPGGDIAAVATLLNTLTAWALSPDGYVKMKREAKIEQLLDALKVALDARAHAAGDLIMAELRRLSRDQDG